jgi:hypothetical protein
MKVWKKVAAITGAIALSATIGAVTASALGSQNDPGPAGDPAPRILGNGITENNYVPIIPCRILDTRKGMGKFQVNQPKAIDVRGSDTTFTTQGGNPGGCGVPNSASAVEVTITAIDSGSGFLRAWPANLTQPNATFLNYDSAFNVGNTGSITLCGANGLACQANKDMNLQAYGSATHLVVDVAGYYQQPMAANVTSAGALGRSSRAVSAQRDGTGVYRVTFDRNISQCTYFGGTATTNGGLASGFVSVTNVSATNTAVSVLTYNTAGELADRGFQVQVVC